MDIIKQLWKGITNVKHRKPGSPLRGSPFGQPNRAVAAGAGVQPSAGGGAGGAGIVTLTFPFTFTFDGPEPEDAGIRAGEIIAKRCWWVIPERRLHSVYMTHCEWFPNVPMEGDVSEGYGVFAFKNTETMIEYGRSVHASVHVVPANPFWVSPVDESYLIAGTVALWGSIVEHEYGYRASYAKILSLDDPKDDQPVDRLLRMKYGV